MSDEADRGAPPRRGKPNLIDVTVPNAARVADYLGGGRDNFAVDRAAIRAASVWAPSVARLPAAARGFRRRVITYLIEAGIRQFLEVEGGMTPPGHTHEVAQALNARCRVLYVESDPLMLSRAQATLRSTPEGVVTCVAGDISDVDAMMASAPPTLDLSQPVGVLLLSALAHVPTMIGATRAVSSLLAPVPSGSYIAIYHVANDMDHGITRATRQWNKIVPVPITLRSRSDLSAFVEGLEVIEPGVVPVSDWRPALGGPTDAAPMRGVVARKR
jgi:hypothetical protein